MNSIIQKIIDLSGGLYSMIDNLQKLKIYIYHCNLKLCRKNRLLTQNQLADILMVSRQTISNLERSKYTPSIFLAQKIANFFDHTIEEIFYYEVKRYE